MKTGVTGLLSVAVASVASVAFAQQTAMLNVPETIKPADGQKVYLTVPATGAQVYSCDKAANGTYAWTFKAPDAKLYDAAKKLIGKHYAGPTWEGNDGSKVVGAVKANAPAPGGNAIPWLNLEIKSREGSGVFSEAKTILRVATVGGTAPTESCTEANAGKESHVPYQATYLFVK